MVFLAFSAAPVEDASLLDLSSLSASNAASLLFSAFYNQGEKLTNKGEKIALNKSMIGIIRLRIIICNAIQRKRKEQQFVMNE